MKVVYGILAIARKDLEIYLNNLNMSTEKNAICFESLAQNKDINKQVIGALYNKY